MSRDWQREKEYMLTMTLVARVLQPHFRRHLTGVPIPTCRLHGFRTTEQQHPSQVRAERRSGYSADVPSNRVCCYCGAPSVPGACCYIHVGGVREWAC